ncbi:odorant receptor 63a-like [Monomorium pharaonis]|uniref:odorant receptor 63a-like n=1 Tax=Monomorium pharaonis TaxID=307658 RepID=UPI0017460D38|nr:odorant receptor 63a-like [Monomorium pharaonis]
MLKNFQREYNINRIILSTSGLWPFQNKYVKNSLLIFCILVEISTYPFEVLLLYDHWDDPKMIFDGCFQMVAVTSFIAKIVHHIWHEDKLQQLCIAIDKHWDIFTNDADIKIMKYYSTLAQRFTILTATLFYSIISLMIVVPLVPVLLDILMPLNESRPRFFAVEIEFRVNEEDYFLPIHCYITIIVVMGVNIALGFDTIHIVFSAHACSLFATVSKHMKNIIPKANNSCKIRKNKYYINIELDPLNEKKIYREYIICLKHHQLAIDFVNMLDSSFREYSLFILLLLLANISLTGIRILNVLDHMPELIKYTLIFLGMVSGLMIICYSGQKILDESQNIFYQAYAAEWYKFSPRLKSLLMITLYRSNVACGLKGGNIVPLSIPTYAAVMRMAMSYFTALLSLQG